MSAVLAVGSDVASTGFALAGIATIGVDVPRDARTVLDEVVERPGLGVLFVEQAVLDAMEPTYVRHLVRRPLPIIVPFPGPARRALERPTDSIILELLQRAIGYRVRL